jgi:hypothetical protein
VAAAVGVAGWWTLAVGVVTVGAVALRWPQVARLWRAGGPGDVAGVSLASWSAALVNNVVWLAFWVVRADTAMVASSVAILAGTVVLVALLVWRRATIQPAPAAAAA